MCVCRGVVTQMCLSMKGYLCVSVVVSVCVCVCQCRWSVCVCVCQCRWSLCVCVWYDAPCL